MAAAAGLILAAQLGGCAVWGPEGGPGGAGAAAASAIDTVAEAVTGPDGVQRVTITLTDDLRLVPSRVRAHPGVIEFTFTNTGATPHAVLVGHDPGTTATNQPGTGNLNSGQTRTVTITVTAPGSYPLPCLYHANSGMRGTLDIA